MPARDRLCASGARLIAAIMVLFTAMPEHGFAAMADETALMLSVVVNDYTTGKIGEFIVRDGALFARSEELRDLGFRVPESTTLAEPKLIRLSDLPDFSYRLDQASQTLYVTAATDRLLPAILPTDAPQPDKYKIESGTGVTANYDVIGSSSHGHQLGSAFLDLRMFSPWGVASSGLLAYAGASPYGSGAHGVIRLDSTYVYSDPGSMRRYRVGDFISGFLPWTRPVRLGGVQINSDFSMRPDLVTFPAPEVSGSVAVPSTVDVLVNGTRVLSREVQPGPFQVSQLPVVTGAGTVSTTVTNALGQQVTTELPFYASPALLAPGLQTYSIEAGAVRHDWGLISDDYGSSAAAITYRRGLSSFLTVEGHGETSRGLFMAGVGVLVNLDNLAVGNLSIAGSVGDKHQGGQVSLGINRLGRRFSIGGSAILATHDFGDIAAVNGDPTVQLELNANVGLSLDRFGSLGLAYAGVERAEQPPPVRLLASSGITLPTSSTSPGPFSFQPAQRSHVVLASYSVQFKGVSVYATAYHDFAQKGIEGVYLGLTIPFGSRRSVSVSAQSLSGIQSGQVQAMQTADVIGQWGYNVLGAVNHPDHEFAQISHKFSSALVSAGVDRFGNQTTLQAEAQGALSFVDGRVFASNHIYDSFAVVDTNGVEGIRVQQENRYAGRTGPDGRVLVPDLQSFVVNHLSIDPLDVPLDITVPFAARDVRPQDRSGVVVAFPLVTTHGALLRLIDQAGGPVPMGSVATLRSTGTAVTVGYEGEAYIVGLQPHNEVDVELPHGRHCSVNFDYRAIRGEIPTVGPLPCREINP